MRALDGFRNFIRPCSYASRISFSSDAFMLPTYLLSVFTSCLPAWYGRLQEYRVTIHYVWNQVNVASDRDEEYLLPWVFVLVPMVRYTPELSGTKEQGDFFKRYAPLFFQPPVLLGIPLKYHTLQCMPIRHPVKWCFSANAKRFIRSAADVPRGLVRGVFPAAFRIKGRGGRGGQSAHPNMFSFFVHLLTSRKRLSPQALTARLTFISCPMLSHSLNRAFPTIVLR